ncbi:hypothetical protein B0A52_09921 [Exophiala mesophila]|uniref:EF-hand domain-containing protein n=1 Tax=Exophiala mesophila TaxID=212818 RepID=A0A438MQU1_EXOME|nr:hypothetical protein B0A52_09921 [Exophiala mesophila]
MIQAKKTVRICCPIGSIGYGFDAQRLYQAIEMGAEALISDAGSTDSGPQKLGLGTSTVPRAAYARDLRPMIDACYHHKVKVLIGSAAGDGADHHVDEFVEIIEEYCREKRYNLKVIKIYASIDKAEVHKALDDGKISPCGAVPTLTHQDIDDSSRIVAQMGVEPYLDAMNAHPDFDVIVGGRAYDPSPFAAFGLWKGLKNVANLFNMGKVLECGGFCAKPKCKEVFCTVTEDEFTVFPLDPRSVCTKQSLAAHSLYENSHADLHPGPGGTLDLKESYYVEHEDGSGTAGGAVFHVANPYTIKLEAAKPTGYRSIWMGSFRDPILIGQITSFLEDRVRPRLMALFKGEDFELNFRVYGRDGTMGQYEFDDSKPKEVFLMGEVKAKTQELANNVASMGRVACVHVPYPGQKGNGGNFAMPLTPLEIDLGPVCQFCIYHLMEVEDPKANFPWSVVEMPTFVEDATPRQLDFGFDPPGTGYHLDKKTPVEPMTPENEAKLKHLLEHGDDKGDGKIALTEICDVLRSKVAGPYEIAFDMIFYNMDCLNRARNSGELTKEKIAKIYNIPADKVIACQFFEQALAFKATIPRDGVAGGFKDRDLHASQQYIPLFNIRV